MANDVTIFESNTGDLAPMDNENISDLGKALREKMRLNRRIQANLNGTFKMLVGGQQVGDTAQGSIEVIIVNMLPTISRQYYAGAYDPKAKGKLPECWSNDGEVPDSGAKDKQAANCASCPQNVKGSGSGSSKACRYQRKLAVMLANDPAHAGQVFQFNVPAGSLFADKKGGNQYGFERYIQYIISNQYAPDQVVTRIQFDPDAETMIMLFTPVRSLTNEENAQVQKAKKLPETKYYVSLTAAEVDSNGDDEPDVKASDEPVKRAKPKAKPVDEATMAEKASRWAEDD